MSESPKPEASLELSFSFPFGRYAATPWFRSRREHVGNVEWPPSPWRIARALVSIADCFGGPEALDGIEGLARSIAGRLPSYRLPSAGQIVYTQWMPQLDFDDSPLARQRLDNGHTLLAVEPGDRVAVAWEGVTLADGERALLECLIPHWHHLGQSVSVCEASLGAGLGHGLRAWPATQGEVLVEEQAKRARLLAPLPDVTLEQLQVSSADGVLKALPAPPGSRWVDYWVEQLPRPPRPREDALVSELSYRLDGVLIPTCAQAEGTCGVAS